MLAKPKISSRRDFKEQYFLYFLSFNATLPELTSSTIHNETKWFKQLKFENSFKRLHGISWTKYVFLLLYCKSDKQKKVTFLYS